jgi:hypothetical protein
VRRREAPPRSPRRHRRRKEHPRVHATERHGRAELLRRCRLYAARVADRRTGRQGDTRAPRLPRRRGSGLPHPQPFGRDPLGWGGTTDKARLAGRERAGGRAVRARRAVDWPPPAGQPASSRHPCSSFGTSETPS